MCLVRGSKGNFEYCLDRLRLQRVTMCRYCQKCAVLCTVGCSPSLARPVKFYRPSRLTSRFGSRHLESRRSEEGPCCAGRMWKKLCHNCAKVRLFLTFITHVPLTKRSFTMIWESRCCICFAVLWSTVYTQYGVRLTLLHQVRYLLVCCSLRKFISWFTWRSNRHPFQHATFLMQSSICSRTSRLRNSGCCKSGAALFLSTPTVKLMSLCTFNQLCLEYGGCVTRAARQRVTSLVSHVTAQNGHRTEVRVVNVILCRS